MRTKNFLCLISTVALVGLIVWCLFFSNSMKGLLLNNAAVSGSLTWRDVFYLREYRRTSGSWDKKFKTIYKTSDAPETLKVFMLFECYTFEKDGTGNWKLKQKSSYSI